MQAGCTKVYEDEYRVKYDTPSYALAEIHCKECDDKCAWGECATTEIKPCPRCGSKNICGMVDGGFRNPFDTSDADYGMLATFICEECEFAMHGWAKRFYEALADALGKWNNILRREAE